MGAAGSRRVGLAATMTGVTSPASARPAPTDGVGGPAAGASAPSAAGGRLRAMDALRLVAALAVVLFHFTARDHSRWDVLPAVEFPGLSQVARYGYVGVHLFFVISGFVILMSLWGRTLPQFVASRVSRLYPALWAAVLLTATLRWLWPTFGSVPLPDVLLNLTMTQGAFGVQNVDGVYWTLWVELQFYLGMVVLVLAGATVRRVMAASVLAPLAATVVAVVDPAWAQRLTISSWLPMFAAGMVLYLIHREGPTAARWAVVGLNTALGVGVAVDQKVDAIAAISSDVRVSPLWLAVLVAGSVAVVAVVALVPAVRDLDLPVLTAAGALTYPLYLTHEYVGWALIEALHPALGRTLTLLVVLALCLGLAWLLHRLVERPLQRPLRRAVQRGLERVGPGRRRS